MHNKSDDDAMTSRIRQVVAGNLSGAFAGIGKAPPKPEPEPEPEPDRVPVIIPPDLGGTPADRLMRNLSTALQRQAEILGQPVDMEDVRRARLVAEVASTTLSAALKAQETHLQCETNMSRNLDRIVDAARLALMRRTIDG
jgi:hypothetical protein